MGLIRGIESLHNLIEDSFVGEHNDTLYIVDCHYLDVDKFWIWASFLWATKRAEEWRKVESASRNTINRVHKGMCGPPVLPANSLAGGCLSGKRYCRLSALPAFEFSAFQHLRQHCYNHSGYS